MLSEEKGKEAYFWAGKIPAKLTDPKLKVLHRNSNCSMNEVLEGGGRGGGEACQQFGLITYPTLSARVKMKPRATKY